MCCLVFYHVLPPSAESHWKRGTIYRNCQLGSGNSHVMTFQQGELQWKSRRLPEFAIPIQSMYGIFIYIYIWLIFMVNIGKYTIHGWYGINDTMNLSPSFKVYCMRHPGGHFSRDYRIIGKYTVNLWTFTRIDWKKWSANPNHPKSSIVSTMCFG